jgi:hypothetical protein
MSRTVRALNEIFAFRRAEEQSARQTLSSEQIAMGRAGERTFQTQDARDDALGTWHAFVADPKVAHSLREVASNWLIGRQNELAAARLDESIATGRYDRAQEAVARTSALVMATRELTRAENARLRKRDDEKHLSAVEELILGRRRS